MTAMSMQVELSGSEERTQRSIKEVLRAILSNMVALATRGS